MIQRLTIVTALALVVGAICTGSALGAGPADSLIGYWKLDGDTLDASGLENHGTAEGNPTFEAGMYDEAMYFDGDADYLVMDSVADDFTDDDLTLSAWIKTADTGTWQWWFSCNTASGGNVIILGLISGNIVVHQGAVQITSTTVVNDLEWRHVAYSRIGGVGSLYIDGVLEGTHTATFALSDDNRWSIAQEWDSASPGDFLDGTVDDVRIYDRGLTEAELPDIMVVQPGIASEPSPVDEAIDVPRDAALAWTPGKFVPAANGHTVYISENLSDVSDGLGGVTQSDNTYTPDQYLAFGTTYYWRVDEVNGAPDYTIYEGEIWSFTVEPLAYPVEMVTATTNGLSEGGKGPENTINGSGLNANDEHSDDSTHMWLASPADDGSLWIEYAFDRAYKLHEALVWNCNVQYETLLGFGMQNVAVEYSEDGVNWTALGDVELAQGAGQANYTANTTIDFGGAAVRYVRLTLNSSFGVQAQYGLSEVRFLSIPAHPRTPEPPDGSTDVSVDAPLNWRAGREAVTHEVHLGTDPSALSLADAIETSTYEASDFDLATTYYWQIVEVNEADAISAWPGDLWTFSTQEYITVDDFESYADESPDLIFQHWIDGWGFEGDDSFPNGEAGNGSGAQVGYLEAPFAERAVIRGGLQSLPLVYDNTSVSYSEATRSFTSAQDWTRSGIATLTVHFRGAPDNNNGQLYVKINDAKVPYDGDADDITKVTWQSWNIDLSTVGAGLTNIRSLTVGVDGAGATGTLYVDDIRLYRVAPVATEEPDSAHLVAHYSFEGDSTDASGNGYHGEIGGDPVFVAGMKGQAIGFDGEDDYVRIPDQDQLNPGEGSFSIAFWANLDPASGISGNASWDLPIAKRGSSGSIGYYIGANRAQGDADQAGYRFMVGDAGGTRVDTGYLPVPLDEWVFVASVLDREQNVHKISVNGGASWATATPPAGSITVAADVGIGWDIGQNNYWVNGTVDEVSFYDVALSDAEVAWLAGN